MKTAIQGLTIGIAVFCLGLIAPQLRADTLDVWSLRNPQISTSRPLGIHGKVDYLNGQFVAFGGASGGLATSTDGTNWTALALPFDGTAISQMTYGNGQYVAAGGTLLASSPDLVNWTYSTNPPQTALYSIAFGNGVFVVVGSSNLITTNFSTLFAYVIRSTDGVNWAQSVVPTNNSNYNLLYDIAFGNGQFVAAEYTPGRILVSTDGTSWTATPAIANYNLEYMSFANGRFYAGGYSNLSRFTFSALAWSADGSTWSPGSDPTLEAYSPFRAVAGNGILLGVSSGDPLTISTDGVNFLTFTTNASNFVSIAFGNGVFADSFLRTSQDGTNWSASAVPPTTNPPVYSITDMFTGTNGYTAFTQPNGNPLLVSPNGIQFFLTTNDTPAFYRVKNANGLYQAVGAGGVLGQSTNGLDWAARNSATANSLYDIEYGNSTWVAVGLNGTITTSLTGNAWTLRFSGTSLDLTGIVYGDNQFVVVGVEGTVLTSPDGINWTAQYSDTLEDLNRITFANGQFVAVGASGTVMTSPDGVNWTPQNSGVQTQLGGIAYGEGTFCVVGNGGGTNVVLTSTNGVSWTQRNSTALQSLTGDAAGVRFLNGTFWVFSDTYILQSGPVTPVQLQINLSANTPRISVQASSNLLLELQSASALTGSWQNLGLFTNPPSGSFMFLDCSAAGQSQRFYRAAAP